MTSINFTAKFGDFSIRQSQSIPSKPARIDGSFHRLTPKQFDALTEAFTVKGEQRALTTEQGRDFRTVEIDFGGLTLTLFSDVPAEVDPNQLSFMEA